MDMVRERVVDGEVQPRGGEGDEGGSGHGDDHGHDSGRNPCGQRPLAPSSSLEMVLVYRWISPQDGCQGGGFFVVPFDLGFLSL